MRQLYIKSATTLSDRIKALGSTMNKEERHSEILDLLMAVLINQFLSHLMLPSFEKSWTYIGYVLLTGIFN